MFKNPSCNYPVEEKEKVVTLREKLEVEDKKLRNFLKKGYLSGEDEEGDGLIDEEQEDFLMYYFTKFETSKKNYKDELTVLMDLPKKKRTKQAKQIKNVQTTIGYLEEHEYYLEQLVKNKELIDQDKVDNIREDMDNFLVHPSNTALREELKAEYQHMLEDIVQELEEQKIEQQKLDIELEAHNTHSQPVHEVEPARPKTRKELREERLRQEQAQQELQEIQAESQQEGEKDDDSQQSKLDLCANKCR